MRVMRNWKKGRSSDLFHRQHRSAEPLTGQNATIAEEIKTPVIIGMADVDCQQGSIGRRKARHEPLDLESLIADAEAG